MAERKKTDRDEDEAEQVRPDAMQKDSLQPSGAQHHEADPRRYLILGICCLSLLIVGMDNTIVNVALPNLRQDLHASVSGLQWTIDAYTLVLASLLVLSGSTADRLGRRRTFQTGLVLFTIGSLLCSLAPGLGWLIAFRMVQAIGGVHAEPGCDVDHHQRLHRSA